MTFRPERDQITSVSFTDQWDGDEWERDWSAVHEAFWRLAGLGRDDQDSMDEFLVRRAVFEFAERSAEAAGMTPAELYLSGWLSEARAFANAERMRHRLVVMRDARRRHTTPQCLGERALINIHAPARRHTVTGGVRDVPQRARRRRLPSVTALQQDACEPRRLSLAPPPVDPLVVGGDALALAA